MSHAAMTKTLRRLWVYCSVLRCRACFGRLDVLGDSARHAWQTRHFVWIRSLTPSLSPTPLGCAAFGAAGSAVVPARDPKGPYRNLKTRNPLFLQVCLLTKFALYFRWT